MTVFVLSLHYRLPGTHKVPRSLKKLSFSFLARIMCMGDDLIRMGDDDDDNGDDAEKTKQKPDVYENTYVTRQNGVSVIDDGGKKSPEDSGIVSGRFESITHDIMTNLRYIVKKNQDEDAEEVVLTEWKYVAVVFDRLFAWLFFLTTVICTLSILCQPKPFTGPGEFWWALYCFRKKFLLTDHHLIAVFALL